jgi:hypothetical protein
MERHACRKRLVRIERRDRYGNRFSRWGDMQGGSNLVMGEETDTGIGWEDGETCIEKTIS